MTEAAANGFTAPELEKWEAMGLIVNFPDHIELLAPFLLGRLKIWLFKDVAALALDGLRVTVHGWKGSGSAGAAAEPLVLRDMAKQELERTNFWDFVQYDMAQQPEISINGGQPFLQNRAGPLRPLQLDDILDRIVAISKDSGLDGLTLTQDQNNNYFLHGIQIKLGEKRMTITPGVRVTQEKYMKTGRKVDDTTVAGIALKGERGLEDVVSLLKKAFDITVTPATMLILTNKSLTADAQNSAGELFICGDVDLDFVHGEAFYSVLSPEARRVCDFGP